MAGLYRQILPKPGAVTPPPKGPDPTPKRQTVPLACQRCRSKKTKCDGSRPSCAGCHAKSVECEYHDSPETTSHALLLKEYRLLEQQNKALLELYEMLKLRPEPEANIIFHRLRGGDDMLSLLSLVKEGDMVADLRNSSPAAPSHIHMDGERKNHARSASSSLASTSNPRVGHGFPDARILNTGEDDEASSSPSDSRSATSASSYVSALGALVGSASRTAAAQRSR
ncbi:hypothetical protein SCAR479_07259 [Seiridium cardinale]|uniref:Zn(2)-C6 fungal-type domain-containing protein n=1 Tax=Seiridium cardinale TaxID=138064 RepID=A0ABR2XQK2_9PEZI